MVRLHIGGCHVHVLNDDDDIEETQFGELHSHIDKRNTLRIIENNPPRIALHLKPPSLERGHLKNHHF